MDNLIILVDYNKIQALSRLEDALPLSDLKKKFLSFNLNCLNVKNGHSFIDLISTFKLIKKNKKPTVIILNTIKGKGVPEFENDPAWHARKLAGKELVTGKKALGIK